MGERIKLTPGRVEEAIVRARARAEERGVPLTLERVAACLGIDRDRLRQLATGPITGSRAEQAAAERLRQVYLDCNAALIEELMACKGSHSGAMLLAKNDFGYTDKAEAAPAPPVRFVGEERLEE
ncbi:MAG: hypothetical protein IJZ13_04095 [Clostridia bacterium]|nr:hypothetical protein [Clostridia bacterium]